MQNNGQQKKFSEAVRRGHEANDVRFRWILAVAGGIVVTVILVDAFLWLFHGHLQKKLKAEDAKNFAQIGVRAESRKKFPEPHLQINPKNDLKIFRAREEAELNSYGWINHQSGIVRIPIERAMDLIVE